MNFRDLEDQAKALAPVIKRFVSKSMEALRSELFLAINEKAKAQDEAMLELASDLQPVAVEVLAERVRGLLPEPQNGKDADPEIIAAMVKEAVDALPPAKPGEDGAPGKDGEDGAPGKNGDSVSLEEIKSLVSEAVATALALVPAAKNGEPGLDGEPGRDGADIDILPAINPEKTYPRGTYATHSGGLWRSHSVTDGMRGWECIVDGLKAVRVEQADDRQFLVNVERASGLVETTQFAMPVVLDKGVYRQNEKYSKGDGVTFGGSFWIARKDSPLGKPGTTDDWRLAVKKGRDGKEGEPGKRGLKGDPGRDGKDLTQMLPDGTKY